MALRRWTGSSFSRGTAQRRQSTQSVPRDPRWEQAVTQTELSLASGRTLRVELAVLSLENARHAAAGLALPVGAWHDPPHRPGLAHLYEHILADQLLCLPDFGADGRAEEPWLGDGLTQPQGALLDSHALESLGLGDFFREAQALQAQLRPAVAGESGRPDRSRSAPAVAVEALTTGGTTSLAAAIVDPAFVLGNASSSTSSASSSVSSHSAPSWAALRRLLRRLTLAFDRDLPIPLGRLVDHCLALDAEHTERRHSTTSRLLTALRHLATPRDHPFARTHGGSLDLLLHGKPRPRPVALPRWAPTAEVASLDAFDPTDALDATLLESLVADLRSHHARVFDALTAPPTVPPSPSPHPHPPTVALSVLVPRSLGRAEDVLQQAWEALFVAPSLRTTTNPHAAFSASQVSQGSLRSLLMEDARRRFGHSPQWSEMEARVQEWARAQEAQSETAAAEEEEGGKEDAVNNDDNHNATRPLPTLSPANLGSPEPDPFPFSAVVTADAGDVGQPALGSLILTTPARDHSETAASPSPSGVPAPLLVAVFAAPPFQLPRAMEPSAPSAATAATATTAADAASQAFQRPAKDPDAPWIALAGLLDQSKLAADLKERGWVSAIETRVIPSRDWEEHRVGSFGGLQVTFLLLPPSSTASSTASTVRRDVLRRFFQEIQQLRSTLHAQTYHANLTGQPLRGALQAILPPSSLLAATAPPEALSSSSAVKANSTPRAPHPPALTPESLASMTAKLSLVTACSALHAGVVGAADASGSTRSGPPRPYLSRGFLRLSPTPGELVMEAPPLVLRHHLAPVETMLQAVEAVHPDRMILFDVDDAHAPLLDHPSAALAPSVFVDEDAEFRFARLPIPSALRDAWIG